MKFSAWKLIAEKNDAMINCPRKASNKSYASRFLRFIFTLSIAILSSSWSFNSSIVVLEWKWNKKGCRWELFFLVLHFNYSLLELFIKRRYLSKRLRERAKSKWITLTVYVWVRVQACKEQRKNEEEKENLEKTSSLCKIREKITINSDKIS